MSGLFYKMTGAQSAHFDRMSTGNKVRFEPFQTPGGKKLEFYHKEGSFGRAEGLSDVTDAILHKRDPFTFEGETYHLGNVETIVYSHSHTLENVYHIYTIPSGKEYVEFIYVGHLRILPPSAHGGAHRKTRRNRK